MPDADASPDADVVHDDPTYVVPSAGTGPTKLITDAIVIANTTCEKCGASHAVMLKPGQDKAVRPCQCGQEIHIARTPPNTQAEPLAEPPKGTTMSVAQEATGLTTYAQAHQQIASELNSLSAASNNLAASMGDLLAQHSNLVGNAAVLQDLINQAAAVADQIASAAAAAATA